MLPAERIHGRWYKDNLGATLNLDGSERLPQPPPTRWSPPSSSNLPIFLGGDKDRRSNHPVQVSTQQSAQTYLENVGPPSKRRGIQSLLYSEPEGEPERRAKMREELARYERLQLEELKERRRKTREEELRAAKNVAWPFGQQIDRARGHGPEGTQIAPTSTPVDAYLDTARSPQTAFPTETQQRSAARNHDRPLIPPVEPPQPKDQTWGRPPPADHERRRIHAADRKTGRVYSIDTTPPGYHSDPITGETLVPAPPPPPPIREATVSLHRAEERKFDAKSDRWEGALSVTKPARRPAGPYNPLTHWAPSLREESGTMETNRAGTASLSKATNAEEWFPFGPQPDDGRRRPMVIEPKQNEAVQESERRKAVLRQQQEELMRTREHDQQRKRAEEVRKGAELATAYPWNWGADEAQRRQLTRHARAMEFVGEQKVVDPRSAAQYSQQLDLLIKQRDEQRQREKEHDAKLSLQHATKGFDAVMGHDHPWPTQTQGLPPRPPFSTGSFTDIPQQPIFAKPSRDHFGRRYEMPAPPNRSVWPADAIDQVDTKFRRYSRKGSIGAGK